MDIKNIQADARYTLFFSPHQDDEFLSMGVDIINHLEDGDNVHVILCTKGDKSYVRRYLSQQKSCNWHSGVHNYGITPEQFIQLRDEEFKASCKALGVASSNIHIYSDRASDQELSVSKAREIIEYYLDYFGCEGSSGCYKIKTLTPWGSSNEHQDHKHLGQAALNLYNEGRYDDLRYYIEPSLINEWKSKNPGKWCGPVTTTSPSKLDNAYTAYKTWNPGSVPGPNQGKTGEVQKVSSGDKLNIRSGPGTSYGVVYTLKNTEEVEIIGSNGGWLNVKCLQSNSYEGKVGWCNSAYIKRFQGCNPSTSKFGIGYHSVSSILDDFKEKKTNYYHTPE